MGDPTDPGHILATPEPQYAGWRSCMRRRSLLAAATFIVVVALGASVATAFGGSNPYGPEQDRKYNLVTLGTGFTFQGRLTDAGSPANGVYDLNFYLYDAGAGGSQVGPVQTIGDVTVTAGLFTVTLNFGDVFHGSQYYLEVQVRPGASAGAYTILTPREAISAVPNASFAAEAASATGLQGVAVSVNAPAVGDVLKFDGVGWAPAAAGGGGSLTLPFSATQSLNGTLFKVTNTSTGASASAIVAEATGESSNSEALTGRITSTSPAGFSAGVRGENLGTGGSGIGVYGTQAGSGWGVYGQAPSGRGVYGSSTSGSGVYGFSSSGNGGYFSSTSGDALEVNGRIKVSGSAPAAFVHTVTSTSCGSSQCSVIDNPATNGNPTAIVMVTQLWTSVYNAHPVGVYYTSGKWAVFNEDLAAMPAGAKFNILVINQ